MHYIKLDYQEYVVVFLELWIDRMKEELLYNVKVWVSIQVFKKINAPLLFI